jgi:hypothetical protein
MQFTMLRTEIKVILKSWIELIKRCESIEKAVELLESIFDLL